MRIDSGKLGYLLGSLAKRMRGEGLDCPSCGCRDSTPVARKYGVTELRRCTRCALMFRSPTTTEAENADFYQARYREGYTTDAPGPEELSRLLASGFGGTERDYSRHVALLDALGVPRSARVLDFGCSWGYGSWQFRQAGYAVESYEVSAPRAEYARKNLGCIVRPTFADFAPGFDAFFSSHVLEHVPSVQAVVRFAQTILKPGGLFVAVTPNGAMARRARDPEGWQKSWGLVHPNVLDDEFYRHCFAGRPWLVASDPYDLAAIRAWISSGGGERVLDLSGGELMCVATMNRPTGQRA